MTLRRHQKESYSRFFVQPGIAGYALVLIIIAIGAILVSLWFDNNFSSLLEMVPVMTPGTTATVGLL
jgi:hypothetical protein